MAVFHKTIRPAHIPYYIVAIALALVAVVAFPKSEYVASGDVWPASFIAGNRVLEHSLQLWGSNITGMGSPYFDPVGVPLGVFNAICGLVGAKGPAAQFLFRAALLLLSGLGTAYFSRALFPCRNFVVTAAGIGVAISLYSALNMTNPIFVFGLGYFPFTAGFVLRRLREPVRWTRFAGEIGLLGLGLYFLATTPPVAVYFCIWVALWLAIGWFRYRTVGKTLVPLLLGALLVVGMNVWWSYAAGITLFGSASTNQTFVSPMAWQWVSIHSSILGQLSMQGMWSWPLGDYFAWAPAYSESAWRFTLYVPAALAIVAVSSIRSRRVFLLFAVVLVSLLIGKGLHEPFQGFNALLYAKLPMFWLFRDPQVESGLTLYPALFILAALGADQLVKFAALPERAAKLKFVRPAASVVVLAVFFSNGLPFVLNLHLPNTWLRGRAKTLVSIPQDWFSAARYINSSPGDGRVLLFPVDDFYQMPYKWGYYGIDEVAQSLLDRRTLTIAPNDLYISGSQGLSALDASIRDAVETAPEEDLRSMLAPLNVQWIIVRGDIDTDFPDRSIEHNDTLKAYFTTQKNIFKVATFGNLTLYRISGVHSYTKEFSGFGYWNSRKPIALANASALLGTADMPWLTLSTISSLADSSGTTAEASLDRDTQISFSQPGKILLRPSGLGVYVSKPGAGRLAVTLRGISLRRSTTRSIGWEQSVPINIDPALGVLRRLSIGSGDFVLPVKTAKNESYVGMYARADAKMKAEVVLRGIGERNLADAGAWAPLGDCRFNATLARHANLTLTRLLNENGIRISAAADLACSKMVIDVSPAHNGELLLTLSYRYVAGAAPAVALIEDGKRGQVFALPTNKTSWEHTLPAAQRSRLEIFVYADADGRGKTIAEYSNLRVVRQGTAGETRVSLIPISRAIPAGRYTIKRVRFFPVQNVVGRWGPAFDAVKPVSVESAGLYAHALGNGTLALHARSDGVGISQIIPGSVGREVALSISARALRGGSPLVRIVDLNSNILWASKFEAAPGWQNQKAVIEIPPTGGDATIALYAFASNGTAEDEYKNVNVHLVAEGAGNIVWVGGNAPGIVASSSRKSTAGSYVVTIAPRTKLLTLSESFDRSWTVTSGGVTLPWEHVVVNGVTNGWIVRGSEPKTVRLSYAPITAFRALQLVAILCFLCAVVLALYRPNALPSLAISKMQKSPDGAGAQ